MHLEREINEQPDVISRLVKEQGEATAQVAAAIRDFDPAFVAIAARGTSDNAARYAQYLFGARARLPVMLSTPSLHTLYQTPPDLSRSLVIGVSQSGQAEDVRRVLQDAREQGALTVSLTNYEDSPMAQTAAHHLYLNAGEEQSIAATKTYTAQLTAVAMLCAALLQDEAMRSELKQLPRNVQEAINAAEGIDAWVERYRYMTQFAAIGRGYNYATAFEINLKVKELCYVTGEGYSEADFRHGPIAMITPGFPVVLVAPQGEPLATLRDLLDKLDERRAEVLVISNDQPTLDRATRPMPVPVIPEWLSPVVTVIPGQVFAMRQAQTRGYKVDQPRGLNKVTVTE